MKALYLIALLVAANFTVTACSPTAPKSESPFQFADANTLDQDGLPPLHTAATYGDLDLAKDLVKRGARIDQKDRFGRTALLVAASSGHADVVAYLIDNGANPLLENNHHENALMASATLRNDQIHHSLKVAMSKTISSDRSPASEK